MNGNTYKQRTRVLKIPVVGDNDGIFPDVELRKYQIIENMLLAGIKGMKNCVFEEGSYSLVPKGDQFSVFLNARGSDSSAKGIVGGAYFDAPPTMEWENLQKGHKYLLYIASGVNTFSSPSDVRATAIEHEKNMLAAVLMATVDLTGTPSLNTNPDTKIYTADLGKHVSDSENPHGLQVVQDEMQVRNRLLLGGENEVILEIKTEGETITLPASLLIPRTIDFTSAGKTGIVLQTVSKVSFVMVNRNGKPNGRLGEIGIGYFGKDASAPDSKSFVIYNDGDSGIPMKALVFFG